MGSEVLLEQVQLNFSFRNKFIILLPCGCLVDNNTFSKLCVFKSLTGYTDYGGYVVKSVSVASKTFKNAHFLKCVIVYQTATRKKNYELVSKAKIELHLFQRYFTPHTPPLKQDKSETTPSPDLLNTRIIRSTIPFRKCFKSSSPMSDFVTHYGPQATTKFTCAVLVPFEHEPSESECR